MLTETVEPRVTDKTTSEALQTVRDFAVAIAMLEDCLVADLSDTEYADTQDALLKEITGEVGDCETKLNCLVSNHIADEPTRRRRTSFRQSVKQLTEEMLGEIPIEITIPEADFQKLRTTIIAAQKSAAAAGNEPLRMAIASILMDLQRLAQKAFASV